MRGIMIKIRYSVLIFLLLFLNYRESAQALAAGCTQHDFNAHIVEHADADNDGIREYVCRQCGYSYTESIPRTGHEYGEYQIEIEPECINEGLRYRVCEECGKVKYEKAAPTGEHIYSEWTVAYHATCAAEGIRQRVCAWCGQIEEEIIAISEAHDFEETVMAATCSTDGEILQRCLQCGEERREIIPAHGEHEYEETIYPATDIEDGSKVNVCRDCQDTYSQRIPAIGREETEPDIKVPEMEQESDPAELPAEQGLFNERDIIISGMNITSVLFWLILIRRDYYIINWDKAQE